MQKWTKYLLISLSVATTLAFAAGKGCNSSSAKDEANALHLKSENSIPIEDFFKNPLKTNFQISPNGKKIAFLAPYQSRLNIFVKNLQSEDSARRVTNSKATDISHYRWANASQIVYLQTNTASNSRQLWICGPGEQINYCLTPEQNIKCEIISTLPQDNDHILIALNKRNPYAADAFQINLHSGKLIKIAHNPGNIIEWYANNNGNITLALGVNQSGSVLFSRSKDNAEFKKIKYIRTLDNIKPLHFSANNQSFYAISNIGRDKKALVELDVKTGKKISDVFVHFTYNIYDVVYSRMQNKITTVLYISTKRQRHFLDTNTQKLFAKLSEALNQKEFLITSQSKNENIMIVRTYDDQSPGTYYLYYTASQKLEKLTDIAPWLQSNDLAEMQPIKYTTSDGVDIYGYLTLPKGKSKNLPTIIYPHDGPWYRDVWGWNPTVQFFANRGYAVLQPNYRGSSGYGKRFLQLSYKQWGKNMQKDIAEGARWMIEKGFADPNRIAIYGVGFGGYSTLYNLYKYPKLYACGINYGGITNLHEFVASIPADWHQYREMIHKIVGHPKKDSLMLYNCSPVYNVNKFKDPLLIFQGRNDAFVDKKTTDKFVIELRKNKVPVKYIVAPNENQEFKKEEQRLDFYRAVEEFLMRYLKSITT